MPVSIDTTVAVAAFAAPFVIWAFKAGVRWTANGTYVRKDLFETRMAAMEGDIEQIRKNTDKIIDHLLNE